MLLDYAAAVDTHHFEVGEGRGDEALGLTVEIWLVVGRVEHGTVDN